jgi:uncharacterized protein
VKIIKDLAVFGCNYKKTTACILLLFAIFFSLGLDKLSFDSSIELWFNKDSHLKAQYDQLVEEFGSDKIAIITIHDAQLWTPDKLSKLQEIQYALEDLPFVDNVDSLFTAQNIKDVDGFIDSSVFIKDVPNTREDALAIKNKVLSNHLALGSLSSFNGDAFSFNLAITVDKNDPRFKLRVHNGIENIIVPYRQDKVFDEITNISFARLGGAINKIVLRDMVLLGGLSVLIMVISLVVSFRNSLACIIPFLTSALTIVYTFGFLAWMGIPINMLMVGVPLFIFVIGSTEDTHILSA